MIQVLLGAGADVNAVGGDGKTPLAAAMEEGRPSTVALLTSAGAHGLGEVKEAASPKRVPVVDSATQAKNVASLCDAAYVGDLRLVHALLSDGSLSPDVANEHGLTALHRASMSGALHSIELLLGHGADVNVRDNEGKTPLHHAAWAGHSYVAFVLISAGADSQARDKADSTASNAARLHGMADVSRLLSGHWTRVGGLDFSHGVLLESSLYARRHTESLFSKVWKWKKMHAVLSRPHKALIFWSGSTSHANGAITRLGITNMKAVKYQTVRAPVTEAPPPPLRGARSYVSPPRPHRPPSTDACRRR